MLAIQSPRRMDSPHSTHQSLLFGYNVNQQDLLFDQPPEPPRGAPILSEDDSRFLTSFLEGVSTDQFNAPSFGEGLNFSDQWLDLPPQFVGSTTSYGQQSNDVLAGYPTQSDLHPAPSHDVHNGMMGVGGGMMAPPPPPPAAPSSQPSHPGLDHLHPTPEMLAAATLLGHGHITANHPAMHSHRRSLDHDSVYNLGGIGQHLEDGFKQGMVASHPQGAFAAPRRNSSHVVGLQPATQQQPRPLRQDQSASFRPRPGPEMQWGSDANFSQPQGFVPHSNKDTYEAMSHDQLKFLECLEVSKSAATTRHPSPTPASPVRAHGMLATGGEDEDGRQRKRRKSNTVLEEERSSDEVETPPTSSAAAPAKPRRGRKPKASSLASTGVPEGRSTPDSGGTPKKRRKSTASGAAKAPRVNLTDKQKRENHIASEQKRRTVIKSHFAELSRIVPDLRKNSMSKSNTLNIACDWIEKLVGCNKEMRDLLETVGG